MKKFDRIYTFGFTSILDNSSYTHPRECFRAPLQLMKEKLRHCVIVFRNQTQILFAEAFSLRAKGVRYQKFSQWSLVPPSSLFSRRSLTHTFSFHCRYANAVIYRIQKSGYNISFRSETLLSRVLWKIESSSKQTEPRVQRKLTTTPFTEEESKMTILSIIISRQNSSLVFRFYEFI